MSWKQVCHVDTVPVNELRKFEIDGISLILANYGSGFRAFPPICPHMEEPLEESGVLADCVMTCTKHLWAWDLKTDAMLGETEKPLQFYETRVDGDLIFARLDKEIVYEFEGEGEDDDDFFN